MMIIILPFYFSPLWKSEVLKHLQYNTIQYNNFI